MLRMTMAEAERLDPLRPKAPADAVEQAHTMIATEQEAQGYAERLEMLVPWQGPKSWIERTWRLKHATCMALKTNGESEVYRY